MTLTATRQTSDPTKKVPTRRMDFEESMRDVPRHFARDGDLISGHVIAALSSVFPDGEDYFVRSVRHYREQVSDPALKRQVAGFIGQEAVHGREHRVFNDRLAELGYPTKHYEKFTRFGLRIRGRLAPAKANLAATAALEHFTATLAEVVLTSEEIRDLMGAEPVRDLFVWHALEESEHKAVAFDVYRAVGGGERLRVWTMNFFRYGFVLGMGMAVVLSLLGDGATYRKGNLRHSWRRLKTSPIVDPKLWAALKDYNRPDFHPDDSDTSALVETWRAELFGENGTLNDKLIGAAA
ncbi:MAG TPA: metal-dependent hydrolase [Acidimicrobiales bacterium]|nr:metal-dependent hydrolase [Acidimicrobiales bacterium]